MSPTTSTCAAEAVKRAQALPPQAVPPALAMEEMLPVLGDVPPEGQASPKFFSGHQEPWTPVSQSLPSVLARYELKTLVEDRSLSPRPAMPEISEVRSLRSTSETDAPLRNCPLNRPLMLSGVASVVSS